jgi:DNA-directed RNA polymerase specialized sigma24 family protein
MSRHDALAKRVRGSRSLSPDEAGRIDEMIDAEKEVASLQILITEAPRGEQDLLREMVDNEVSVTEASRAIGISLGAGHMRLARLRGRLRLAAQPANTGAPGDQPVGSGGERSL